MTLLSVTLKSSLLAWAHTSTLHLFALFFCCFLYFVYDFHNKYLKGPTSKGRKGEGGQGQEEMGRFFFIFQHSWAPKRCWKIYHGVLESPVFFVSKRVGTLDDDGVLTCVVFVDLVIRNQPTRHDTSQRLVRVCLLPITVCLPVSLYVCVFHRPYCCLSCLMCFSHCHRPVRSIASHRLCKIFW